MTRKKTILLVAATAVVALAVGTFAGMELQKAAMRSAFADAGEEIQKDMDKPLPEDEQMNEDEGGLDEPAEYNDDPDAFYAAVLMHPDWVKHHDEWVPKTSTEGEYKVNMVSASGYNACLAMDEGDDMQWFAEEQAAEDEVSVEAEEVLVDAAKEHLCPA